MAALSGLPSERELAALAAKADSLAPDDVQRLYAGLTGAITERARTDGLFWLRFVQTRDEADPEHSVKAFPLQMDYLRELWRVFTDRQLVVIAKSRQMLVSWVVAAYCVWTARSKPHQAVFWQAQKAEDAVSMVCSPEGAAQARCQFIESHLPPWMRVPVKPLEGRLVYPNGSVIQALAGGADKIRGKTASLIVLDEFAHFEEQQGVYTSVAPLIQKGCKLVIVSTPNGSTNLFSTLWHGRPVSAETTAVAAGA